MPRSSEQTNCTLRWSSEIAQLEAAGYHAQVAVAPQSSLLFLIDRTTGARIALKRTALRAPRSPTGLWQAGARKYSTADLLGILDAEPERISPVGAAAAGVSGLSAGRPRSPLAGPPRWPTLRNPRCYSKRILGRMTPVHPRFSATLIEPAIGDLLTQHELTLERIFAESQESLAQLLGRARHAHRRQAQAGRGRKRARPRTGGPA